MEIFRQEVKKKPTPIDLETAKLRANLILEEAFETITKGLGLDIHLGVGEEDSVYISERNLKNDIHLCYFKNKEVDLVELADGLADLHYVAYCGTAAASGIDMEPIFQEVDDSNKSKLWTAEELVQGKLDYPTATAHPYKDRFIFIREDGKFIKSPSYRPADIKSIIEKQQLA